VNHALACADANIQLLKCPHDDTKHVLNGVTFTVTAFHEGTNVYVAAETFHKELPGFDNLQAGALASRTFWVEPSGHESSQSMQQLWQKAVDDLSASGAALSEQVPVGDTVAGRAWMRRELQQLVQQSSEALMAQASAEIALRLGKAQA
jgi:hypothetical protein